MSTKTKQKWSFYFVMVLCNIVAPCQYVLAKDDTAVQQVTEGMEQFKNVALSVVQGIAVIFFIAGMIEFASGWNDHQTATQMQALKKLGSCVLLFAVPAILKLFT